MALTEIPGALHNCLAGVDQETLPDHSLRYCDGCERLLEVKVLRMDQEVLYSEIDGDKLIDVTIDGETSTHTANFVKNATRYEIENA